MALLIFTAEVFLSPQHGNQLGGTPVLIRGLCLEPSDSVVCIFDGRPSVGQVVDGFTALCTTPIMDTLGTVQVRVRRINRMSSRRAELTTSFTTGKLSLQYCGAESLAMQRTYNHSLLAMHEAQ